jgi:hypothetical protein
MFTNIQQKFFHLFYSPFYLFFKGAHEKSSFPKEQTLFVKTKRTLLKPYFEVGGAKKSSPMICFLKITRRFANKSQTHHFVIQIDEKSVWTKFFKQDFCFHFTCLFSTNQIKWTIKVPLITIIFHQEVYMCILKLNI